MKIQPWGRLAFRSVATSSVAALALTLVVPVAAQSRLPPGVRGGPMSGMATRSVSKYLGLERALNDALLARDRASVQHFLGEGFEVRTAASADPVDAELALDRMFDSATTGSLVQDLAVRELDDLAVVSFLLQEAPPRKAGSAARALFVVDVWRQSSGKLLTRYADRPAVPPARHTRPTGRE